jgi:hypothetical protein
VEILFESLCSCSKHFHSLLKVDESGVDTYLNVVYFELQRFSATPIFGCRANLVALVIHLTDHDLVTDQANYLKCNMHG